MSPGPPVPRSYPKKTYFTRPDTPDIQGLPIRNGIVNLPELPHANIELIRNFTAESGLFYTIRSGANSGFGFTLAQVEAMELKRLNNYMKKNGGKRRHTRRHRKTRRRN